MGINFRLMCTENDEIEEICEPSLSASEIRKAQRCKLNGVPMSALAEATTIANADIAATTYDLPFASLCPLPSS
jgi:hypothetical protein